MKVSLYPLIRRLLFLLPAELAHEFTLSLLNILHKTGLLKLFIRKPIVKPLTVFGLTFANPIGLAAGFDKNADYIDMLFALGFGFVEVGTVTPQPQQGNPKPRLFRITQARALINRMGFNNKGVEHLVKNLQRRRSTGIVGVNIGKNKQTPMDIAAHDYVSCMRHVYPYADYITINISSPNTQDLRQLQQHTQLDNLLHQIDQQRTLLQQHYQKQTPLLIKLSPDIAEYDLEQTIAIILQHRIDGLIISNTSTSRDGLDGLPHVSEQGGLSGAPIAMMSTGLLGEISRLTHRAIPLIGVGGIDDVSSAQAKLAAGASLIQLYSGLIYAGPNLINILNSMN